MKDRQAIEGLFASIEKELSGYLKSLSGVDNLARYKHGKLTVAALTFLVPTGATQLSKLGKLKEVLRILKSYTRSQLDEFLPKFRRFMDERLVGNAGDVIFGSARDFVRTKYGQDVLNRLAVKFGTANDGAIAVILQKWGDESLAILNKSKVKNLDDFINELLKGKTGYRHVGSSAPYLQQMKLTGKIPARIGDDLTYFSLDKFDDPLIAIDKMQLNSASTDAIWRAEFETTQLFDKARFPKGKWNDAEYIEVLTKSYPEFGSGGASQFITQSDIILKRLVNLKTGETISF